MESLSRVAYGPSPPPQGTKGKPRATRGTPHGDRSAASLSVSAARSNTSAAPSPRTRDARRLVEDYWLSVRTAGHEPPLYHTYSDRYGGTRGVPYASRRADAAGKAAADAAEAAANVPACLALSDEAFSDGRLSDARAHLEHVLTLLQNSAEAHGALTVADLTLLRGTGEGDPQQSFWLGETLRRLGTMELIRGNYAAAQELLDGSVAANPLSLDTYLLRASCCEALRCFADAYEDYAKYMKMTEPSMEVLAHSGKCAAEAGLTEVAREQLGRLLQLSEELLRTTVTATTGGGPKRSSATGVDAALVQLSSTIPPLSNASFGAGALSSTVNGASLTRLDLLRRACNFYVAHAHFYLGYVADMRGSAAAADGATRAQMSHLRQEAAAHYTAVLCNGDYVQTYEASVVMAMEAGDFPLARHLLRYLQRMNPHHAEYFLDTATACRAERDVKGELCALSAALDRQQTATERRATLLARGAVYADSLHDWSRAIRDFTLLLSIPTAENALAGDGDGVGSGDVDWSTPLALVRRALAYRRRQADHSRGNLLRREDEEAALVDYAAFLDALVDVCAVAGISRQMYETAHDRLPFLCQPSEVISALLVLANGAFRAHQYASTVEYFSRAIALGWNPESPSAALPPSEKLADQLYLSLAHHVMSLYPIGDEMFRVPYEAREATTVSVANAAAAPGETRRSTKTGGAGPARSSGAEGERSGLAYPPLLYVVVDQRYQRLRALEPTFFAAIEDAFLDLWEPYHSEVERLREEALSSRAGRRGKR